MDNLSILLEKDQLTSEERDLVLNILRKEVRDPFLIDKLLKHNILNTITVDLYLNKSSDDQVKTILSGSIPIIPKDIPVVVFLVIKSYPHLYKELFQYLIKLDNTNRKSLIKTAIFDGEYLYFLTKLLKNDVVFVTELIARSKVDNHIFEILINSTEPEVLFRISNLRNILEKNIDFIKSLLANPYTPDESVIALKQLLVDTDYAEPEKEDKVETASEDKKDIQEDNEDILPHEIHKDIEENLSQKISKMSIPEKIKLALKGNKSARMFLIRDPNKQISLSVLSNPKITEDEISFIVKSKSTPEHIMREIAKNNTWSNNYLIVRDMVFNPKTPIDISMNFLGKLSVSDVEKLSKSKEVPSALKNQALRIFMAKTGKK